MNFAEPGAFVIPSRRNKYIESQATECATIKELDALKEHDQAKKLHEQQQTVQIPDHESEFNKDIAYPLYADPSSSMQPL